MHDGHNPEAINIIDGESDVDLFAQLLDATVIELSSPDTSRLTRMHSRAPATDDRRSDHPLKSIDFLFRNVVRREFK